MADPRKGREGSRWYNERPTSEQFAEWFRTVPIHDGLDHEDFISGITLIQQKEKGLEIIGFDPNGQPQMMEATNLVYIPYAKVDTRIAYFWKFMALHPQWYGTIEPHSWPGQLETNFGLPPGYFGHVQTHGEKKTAYVGCSMVVKVFEGDSVTFRDVVETGPGGKAWRRRVAEGKPVFGQPAPGTKIVATAGRYEADHFSVMKSETGAVGRALGMAGMLVIPGSGVATAEDMQEAQAPAGATSAAAALPEVTTDVADQENDPAFLRDRVAALLTKLGAEHPDSLKAFQTWARERGFTSVDTLSDVQVKGVVKKLERTLDDVQQQVRAAAPALAAEDVDGPPRSQARHRSQD